VKSSRKNIAEAFSVWRLCS